MSAFRSQEATSGPLPTAEAVPTLLCGDTPCRSLEVTLQLNEARATGGLLLTARANSAATLLENNMRGPSNTTRTPSEATPIRQRAGLGWLAIGEAAILGEHNRRGGRPRGAQHICEASTFQHSHNNGSVRVRACAYAFVCACARSCVGVCASQRSGGVATWRSGCLALWRSGSRSLRRDCGETMLFAGGSRRTRGESVVGRRRPKALRVLLWSSRAP